jgi:hypothetical protein
LRQYAPSVRPLRRAPVHGSASAGRKETESCDSVRELGIRDAQAPRDVSCVVVVLRMSAWQFSIASPTMVDGTLTHAPVPREISAIGFDSPLYGIVPIWASVAPYTGGSQCTPSQRRGSVRHVKRRSTTTGRHRIQVWFIAATSVISNSPQNSSPRSWSSHRWHPSLPTETERRRVALHGQKSDRSCDAREISSLARPAASDSSPAFSLDKDNAVGKQTVAPVMVVVLNWSEELKRLVPTK